MFRTTTTLFERSENIAFHLHRGRSRGSQGLKSTQWRTPTSGSKVVDFSFHMHRGRSARDPHRSNGSESTPGHRPPNLGHRPRRKICDAKDTAEVIWCHQLHFRPLGLSSSGQGPRWLHSVAGHRVAGPPSGHLWRGHQVACTSEDLQKTPAASDFSDRHR